MLLLQSTVFHSERRMLLALYRLTQLGRHQLGAVALTLLDHLGLLQQQRRVDGRRPSCPSLRRPLCAASLDTT